MPISDYFYLNENVSATVMLNVNQILSVTYKKKLFALFVYFDDFEYQAYKSKKRAIYLTLRRERFDALLSASEPLSDILLTSESDISLYQIDLQWKTKMNIDSTMLARNNFSLRH